MGYEAFEYRFRFPTAQQRKVQIRIIIDEAGHAFSNIVPEPTVIDICLVVEKNQGSGGVLSGG